MRFFISVGMVLLAATIVYAQGAAKNAPDIDSIIPASAGGDDTVRSPEAVKIEKSDSITTVSAPTAQNATNAAVAECSKNLLSTCVKMKFPSGEGYVAMGISEYKLVQNIDKNRVVKRESYVKAYVEAMATLASTLGNPQVSKQINFENISDSLLDDDKTRENTSESYEEKINTMIKFLVQGAVIYKVDDDKENQLIRVWIFTTPKTSIRKTGPVFMDAETLRVGIANVFDRVRNGVVPPLGGMIVTVPKTDAIAYVSFGSGVVTNGRSKINSLKMAQLVSEMRASAALLELLNGSNIETSRNMLESSKEEVKDFAVILADDPTDNEAFTSIDRLEKQKQQSENIRSVYQKTSSGQSGTLPAGVNTQSWVDDEGAWVYTIKVYVPAETEMPEPIPGHGMESRSGSPSIQVNPDTPSGVVTDPNDL